MTFPCTACGACCRRLYAVADHGLPMKSDGSCGHLVENKCAIYDTRPKLCRIEGEFEANAKLCNAWQVEDGMAEEFRVRLG